MFENSQSRYFKTLHTLGSLNPAATAYLVRVFSNNVELAILVHKSSFLRTDGSTKPPVEQPILFLTGKAACMGRIFMRMSQNSDFIVMPA